MNIIIIIVIMFVLYVRLVILCLLNRDVKICFSIECVDKGGDG